MNGRHPWTLGRGITDGITMTVWIITRVLLIYLLSSVIASANGADISASTIIRSQDNERRLSAGSSKDMYPNRLDALAIVNNRTNTLRLTKHIDLLAPNYKEIYFENGIRIVNKATVDSKDLCIYEGTVDSDQKSHAAINLCHGRISGTVYFNGLRYDISPNSTFQLFYLVPAVDDVSVSNVSCGHASKHKINTANDTTRAKRAANKFPDYYKKYTNWKDLYVEMAVVFDNSVYRTVGSDKDRLFHQAKEYASYINSFYQPVNIKVALVGVEVWSESDRIRVTENGDTTLDSFLRYRRVHVLPDMPNDHAQLITMVPFGGGVVGKAMKGTICSLDLSGAVVMSHSRYPSTVAATMAHEMGHNFGMEHDNDTCRCPQAKCIMAASSSSASNMYWSSCSMEYLSWTLSHGGDFCLKNKPSELFDTKRPLCGNGFVEDGEQCDCGLPGVCDNPCCNATTCQLAEGALCAEGGCCDRFTCKFKPKASACRESRDECDLPEYCDGKSETCPNDTHMQNGLSCMSGQAFCYNGSCNSHTSQCKLIWGPSGSIGASECYNLNTRGDMQGNCGYKRLDGSYTPCPQEDVMCGSLQCSQKTERTHYGDRSLVRMAYTEIRYQNRIVTCHTASIDLGSEENDPGLVPSGAKCGDGKMCSGRKCIAVTQVLAESACTKPDCSGNGVCNNFGHCHCKIGFGGYDCGSIGLGGSVDSGPASLGESTSTSTTTLITTRVSVPSATVTRRPVVTTASTVHLRPDTTLPNDNGSLELPGFPANRNNSDSDFGGCILFEACAGFNIGLGVLIFVIVILPLVSALLTYLYKKGKFRNPKVVKVFDKPSAPKNVRTKPRPSIGDEKKSKPTATSAASKTNANVTSRQPTTPKQPAAFPSWPPATTTSPCAVTDTSKSFPKPTVTVSLQDGLLPVLAAIAASNTTLNTTSSTSSQPMNFGPIKPRRPTDNSLAKVQEVDETAAISYTDAALDEDDVIMSRRPAPPPPPASDLDNVNAQATAPVPLVDIKRMVDAARNCQPTLSQPSPALHPMKKPIQEKPPYTAATDPESSQKANSRVTGPLSKPLLPSEPLSKTRVVQEEKSPVPPKPTKDVSYSVVEKKTKPPLLPPRNPAVVQKNSELAKSPPATSPKEHPDTYYDIMHSKSDPPQVPKKEPLLPKKPLKPVAQVAKEEKPVPTPPVAPMSEKPALGPAKAPFVTDLEKRLKNDTAASATSGQVASGKKALIPPTTPVAPNQKPLVAKKTSGAKEDSGLVSALAARFEKARQN